MATLDALTGVLTRTAGQSLPVAAREFASAGVPVFPCVPGGKRPLTPRGFHDATTDTARVSAWWQQHPGANIGVPTGERSGLVVVDVDVHGTVHGFAAFERVSRAGLVDGWQVLVDTPSGGMHAYYPATPGQVQPSWQAARAGIDFRGDGGYIIVPPSTTSPAGSAADDGAGSVGVYRVRQVNSGLGGMLDASRLRAVLDPKPPPAPRSTLGSAPVPAAGTRRGVDASRLAAWVATRGEGERNRSLFWAACRLAENGVPASDALDVLASAAASAGLGEREIATTVRSAYRIADRPPASPRSPRSSAAEGWFDHTPARAPATTRELS